MDSQTVSSHVADLKGIPTKENLEQKLSTGIFLVVFDKLDGEERQMFCTTFIDLIPEEHRPKNQSKKHEKTIAVWDVNANAWRSFRYDKVKYVAKLAADE